MSPDELKRVAEDRSRSHRQAGHPGRWVKPDLRNGLGDYIGLLGEREFSKRYSVPLDLSQKLSGDGGADGYIRTIYGRFNWDVKTFRKPVRLLVDADCCHSRTIYVLGRFYEATESVELIGWQWGKLLIENEPRDYGRCGIISYGLMAESLRTMKELDEVVIWS